MRTTVWVAAMLLLLAVPAPVDSRRPGLNDFLTMLRHLLVAEIGKQAAELLTPDMVSKECGIAVMMCQNQQTLRRWLHCIADGPVPSGCGISRPVLQRVARKYSKLDL